MMAAASGQMGLLDDDIAAFAAPIGVRRYSKGGHVAKLRRGM
jgi:hypothetical protein